MIYNHFGAIKRSLTIFLAVLGISGIAQGAAVPAAPILKQTRNLVMLLDNGAGESILTGQGSFAGSRLKAIFGDKNVPMVASGSILHQWFEKVEKCRCALHSISRADTFAAFDIFKIQNTQEYLFIPKKLLAEQRDFFNSSFNLTNSKILTPISGDELMRELNAIWGANRFQSSQWRLIKGSGVLLDRARVFAWVFTQKVKWQELKKIFVLGSTDWIVNLGGHGIYTAERFQKKGSICSLRPEQLKDLHNVISFTQISGLTLADHNDLLKFLGTEIKTNVFYESTCFLGGCHEHQIRQLLELYAATIKDFKPYMYIAGSSADIATYGGGSKSERFGVFFDQLSKLAQDKGKEVKEADELLKSALLAVSPESYEAISYRSIPTLFMPGARSSKIVDIYDNAIEINDGSDLDDAIRKKTIILNSPMIGNLSIQGYLGDLKVISRNPGNVHRVKEINLNYTDLKDFFASFYKLAQPTKKAFIMETIKKLSKLESFPSFDFCDELKNIIIEKGYKSAYLGVSGDLKIVGAIYFQYKDKYYKATVESDYESDENRNPAPKFSPFTEISKAIFDKKHAEYA